MTSPRSTGRAQLKTHYGGLEIAVADLLVCADVLSQHDNAKGALVQVLQLPVVHVPGQQVSAGALRHSSLLATARHMRACRCE